MEELLRLINNFEYDRNKFGLLDDETRYFLVDIRNLIEDAVNFAEEEYERGKDEGYEEGKNDKDTEYIDDAISKLTEMEDIIREIKWSLQD
jgi:hypothetical protein